MLFSKADHGRPAIRGAIVALPLIALLTFPAAALEEGAKEKETLDACEKSICELLVKREARR